MKETDNKVPDLEHKEASTKQSHKYEENIDQIHSSGERVHQKNTRIKSDPLQRERDHHQRNLPLSIEPTGRRMHDSRRRKGVVPAARLRLGKP
jgi:hypothetical protein